MISWITDKIGTGAYEKAVSLKGRWKIIDVRQLVDKGGNSAAEIKRIVQSALGDLKQGGRIVICCDHGISRSNAIACGVLATSEKISFYEAVRRVLHKTAHAEIKPDVLDVVRQALDLNSKRATFNNAVLVTGATGDLGPALLPLIHASVPVFPVLSKEINLQKDLTLLYALVREKGIKTIVHLAHPRVANTNTAMSEALVMLKNIIDVCILSRCKLIFVSSLEIYRGNPAGNLVVKPKTRKMPKGVLGETKYLCEELIRLKTQGNQLSCCVIRFPALYGKDCLKPYFLKNFIDKAKAGKNIYTHKYHNGYPLVDLLHIDDAAACLNELLKKKVTGDFSVSGGHPLSTHSIAKIINLKLNSSSALFSIPVRDKNCNIVADNKIALKHFGWRPLRSFPEAIDELF